MPSPKHILILTADAGSGHRSAARALSCAFERLYPDQVRVAIINPIRQPGAARMLRLYERSYLDVLQQLLMLYHLGYVSPTPRPSIASCWPPWSGCCALPSALCCTGIPPTP
ncbi:MAG: hypothetical protein RLZZ387_615 [Chloroflexota bacterium]|jgi:1,2-diacylglycerol 3-beta-galactosyltransferase